jgi:hypothetical protein
LRSNVIAHEDGKPPLLAKNARNGAPRRLDIAILRNILLR